MSAFGLIAEMSGKPPNVPNDPSNIRCRDTASPRSNVTREMTPRPEDRRLAPGLQLRKRLLWFSLRLIRFLESGVQIFSS